MDSFNDDDFDYTFPVRCPICGKMISSYQNCFEKLIHEAKLTPGQTIFLLGIRNDCCRGLILSDTKYPIHKEIVPRIIITPGTADFMDTIGIKTDLLMVQNTSSVSSLKQYFDNRKFKKSNYKKLYKEVKEHNIGNSDEIRLDVLEKLMEEMDINFKKSKFRVAPPIIRTTTREPFKSEIIHRISNESSDED